jgi:hypothetical protein
MLAYAFASLNKPTTNISVAASNGWGTNVPSGAADTSGSWISLGATPAWGSFGLTVCFTNSGISSTTTNGWMDIGVGPNSGAVIEIAEKLACGYAAPFAGTPTTQSGGRIFHLPLFVPPNTTLWGRHQNRAAATSCAVMVTYSGGEGEHVPICSKIVALGSQPTFTLGQDMTTSSIGVSGAEGIWYTMVASTTDNYVGLLLGAMHSTSFINPELAVFDVATGAAGSELVIGENIHRMANFSTEQMTTLSVPVYAPIKAGSRIACRGSSSAASPTLNLTMMTYGMLA